VATTMVGSAAKAWEEGAYQRRQQRSTALDVTVIAVAWWIGFGKRGMQQPGHFFVMYKADVHVPSRVTMKAHSTRRCVAASLVGSVIETASQRVCAEQSKRIVEISTVPAIHELLDATLNMINTINAACEERRKNALSIQGQDNAVVREENIHSLLRSSSTSRMALSDLSGLTLVGRSLATMRWESMAMRSWRRPITRLPTVYEVLGKATPNLILNKGPQNTFLSYFSRGKICFSSMEPHLDRTWQVRCYSSSMCSTVVVALSFYPTVITRRVVTTVVKRPLSMHPAVPGRLWVTKVVEYPLSMYAEVVDCRLATEVLEYPSSTYAAMTDRLMVTKTVQYPSSMYPAVAGHLVITKVVEYPSSMYPAVAGRLMVMKVVQHPSSMYPTVADRLVVTKVVAYPSSMYSAVTDCLVVTKVVECPSSMYSAVADRLVVTKTMQYPSSLYPAVADCLVVIKVVEHPSSMYPAIADQLVVTKTVQHPSSMYPAVADRLVVTKLLLYSSQVDRVCKALVGAQTEFVESIIDTEGSMRIRAVSNEDGFVELNVEPLKASCMLEGDTGLLSWLLV